MAFDMAGLVVTASSENNTGDWNRAGAFDGVIGDNFDAWASASGPPQWLQAQVTNAQICGGYDISARPSAPDQAPNAWTFLGSNDGATWTTLDTRSGQVFSAGETKHYTFLNSIVFNYYRINITAVNGGGVAAISELTFLGVTPPPTTTLTMRTSSRLMLATDLVPTTLVLPVSVTLMVTKLNVMPACMTFRTSRVRMSDLCDSLPRLLTATDLGISGISRTLRLPTTMTSQRLARTTPIDGVTPISFFVDRDYVPCCNLYPQLIRRTAEVFSESSGSGGDPPPVTGQIWPRGRW